MADEQLPTSINFDYIKGNNFRVVHADGAFLGLTGEGGMTITFYSERQPIPRRVVHKVEADGKIGPEIPEQRVVRDAIVREAETCISMTLETSKKLLEAITRIISNYERITAEASKP